MLEGVKPEIGEKSGFGMVENPENAAVVIGFVRHARRYGVQLI
jgi:hypothetical protein